MPARTIAIRWFFLGRTRINVDFVDLRRHSELCQRRHAREKMRLSSHGISVGFDSPSNQVLSIQLMLSAAWWLVSVAWLRNTILCLPTHLSFVATTQRQEE